MHALDTIPIAIAFLVAVWLLRPLAAQALRVGVVVPPTPDVRRPRATAEAAVADEDGPYPRLATKVAELDHAFKLLSNEWLDKESRIDSLIKRIHRLNKVQGADQVEAAPAVPLTREAVLARFRAQQNGGQ